MNEKFPMTKEGYQMLLDQRIELKDTIPSIIKEIQVAREHGDLSENAEYKYAREAKRNTERKIGEIEYKLQNAEIIDVTEMMEDEIVIFGSTITIIDVDTNEKITYKIVGEDEAGSSPEKISYLAPMVKFAIGKEPGDEFTVKTAKGVKTFEIDEVKYI